MSAPRRVAAAVGRAGGRRCTLPRSKAIPHPSRSCCCAAPTGPSRTTSGTAAPHSRNRKPQQPPRAQAHAEATGGTVWKARGIPGGREGGALPPAASQPRHPPCLAPHPSPRCLCRRRVPSALADPAGREATAHVTRTVTSARAARLVVHYCTRGSKGRAHRALAAAATGGVKRASARSAVPLTAMGDRRVVHANARATRRSASSPFRPLSRRVRVCYCRPSSNVRHLTRCVYSPCMSVCPAVRVLAPQYVGIGPSSHRMDACVGRFPLKFDFSQCAADTAALLENRFFRCVCGWGGGGG